MTYSPSQMNDISDEILLLLETMPVPITLLSLKGVHLFQNQAWKKRCETCSSPQITDLLADTSCQEVAQLLPQMFDYQQVELTTQLAQAMENQTHLKLHFASYQARYILVTWLGLFTPQPQGDILLQELIDISNDGIFALDTDYNFIAFNRAVQRSHHKRFGIDVYLGKNFFEGVSDDFKETLFPHFQRALLGESYTFSFTQPHSQPNEVITVQAYMYALKNQQGKVKAICLFGHNVSTTMRIERELKESQQHLQSIIASVDNKVFVLNDKCEFVNVWARDENTLFFPKTAILGKSFREVFGQSTPEFATLYETTLQKVLDTGNSLTIEYDSPVPHDQGYYSATMTIIKENGIPTRKVAVGVRDITKKKEIADEKEKLLQEVMLKNRNLEQFTYIVSHNLRSPLVRVIGLTSILDKENPASAFNLSILEKLVGECHRIDHVLTDLNTILNIQKNTQEISEEVALKAAFYHVFEATSPESFKGEQPENLQLSVNFDAAPKVWGIKGYIHSIFHNLISNAIKYRSQDRTLRISCTTRLVEPNMVEIIFTDNGIGIDLKLIENKLFGLYQRFHNHVSGKGLGLHITKVQIEVMRGSIEVHSKVGEGTSFHIQLPAGCIS